MPVAGALLLSFSGALGMICWLLFDVLDQECNRFGAT